MELNTSTALLPQHLTRSFTTSVALLGRLEATTLEATTCYPTHFTRRPASNSFGSLFGNDSESRST